VLLAVCWSSLFHNIPEDQGTESADCTYSVLAVALKDGHIALWTVHCPVTDDRYIVHFLTFCRAVNTSHLLSCDILELKYIILSHYIKRGPRINTCICHRKWIDSIFCKCGEKIYYSN